MIRTKGQRAGPNFDRRIDRQRGRNQASGIGGRQHEAGRTDGTSSRDRVGALEVDHPHHVGSGQSGRPPANVVQITVRRFFPAGDQQRRVVPHRQSELEDAGFAISGRGTHHDRIGARRVLQRVEV